MRATGQQQNDLKALAEAILQRNKSRNQNATETEKPRNFYPENSPQKLHESCAEIIVQQGSRKVICHCCKKTDFWLSIHGKYICRRCHPPAPGAEVV
jgi:hypothetical protein